jgi:hypothetical protein
LGIVLQKNLTHLDLKVFLIFFMQKN